MLHCLFLMGNLFVSDGQVMIEFSSMSRIERSGNLLLIGAAGREDALDISAYPDGSSVHGILADCATQAQEDTGIVTRARSDLLP